MPRRILNTETDTNYLNQSIFCNFCSKKFRQKSFLITHLLFCDPSINTSRRKEPIIIETKENTRPDSNSTQPENWNTQPHNHIAQPDNLNIEPRNQSPETNHVNEEPKNDIETEAFDAVPQNVQLEIENCNVKHNNHKIALENCEKDPIVKVENINLILEPLDEESETINEMTVKIAEPQNLNLESENHSNISEDRIKTTSKKTKWKKGQLKCRKCNILCKSRSALYLHKANEHGESNGKLEQFGKKCVCQKAYNTTAKLRFHIRKDHFNLQATLPYCEQKKVNQVWFEKVRNCNNIMEIKKTAPNTLVMRKLNEKTAIKVDESRGQAIDLTKLYPTGKNKCR